MLEFFGRKMPFKHLSWVKAQGSLAAQGTIEMSRFHIVLFPVKLGIGNRMTPISTSFQSSFSNLTLSKSRLEQQVSNKGLEESSGEECGESNFDPSCMTFNRDWKIRNTNYRKQYKPGFSIKCSQRTSSMDGVILHRRPMPRPGALTFRMLEGQRACLIQVNARVAVLWKNRTSRIEYALVYSKMINHELLRSTFRARTW